MNEPLFKERSYVKSISAGTRLLLRHPWGFLRQLWPAWILSAILWGAAAKWIATHLWECCQTAFAEGVSASELIDAPLFRILGWGLLACLMLGWCTGQACFMMRRYGELNYLPAVQPWKIWRDQLPLALRGTAVFALAYLLLAALSLLCLALIPSRIWAFVVFCILLIIAAIFAALAGTRYQMADGSLRTRLQGSGRRASHLGSWSAIVAVCGMLTAAIVLVGAIPVICTTYVGGLSDASVAMGDGTDIPGSFAFLRALSFALMFLITQLAWMFLTIPLCFNWGSEMANKPNEEEAA